MTTTKPRYTVTLRVPGTHTLTGADARYSYSSTDVAAALQRQSYIRSIGGYCRIELTEEN